MKWIIILALIIGGVWLWSNNQSQSKDSIKLEASPYHRTVVERYMEAILTQNLQAMSFYSTGMAKETGSNSIQNMLKGYPGQFSSYSLRAGGAPTGDRTSGFALMYGANGDMFCELDFELQKIDGNWYVSGVGTKRAN